MDNIPSPGDTDRKITRRDVLKHGGEVAALAAVGNSTLTGSTPEHQALQGLNLGGWLVAERWMTPDLFDGVSGEGERAIGRELPVAEAQARISAHRNSFITEEDFKWISEHDFDFVRLPFGYWLMEEAEAYVQGEEYLSRAFEWAEVHGLKVLLDFHGLQGSQNGNDHSGETGRVDFYKSNNIDRALSTVEHVTSLYGSSKALLGIEVINEPKLQRDLGLLMDYYERAYRLVDAGTGLDARIVVSDGFQTERVVKALGRRSFGDKLVLDLHLYQLYTAQEKNMTLDEHVQKVKTDWKHTLSELGGRALVGEWTAALPNKAVQGRDPMDALKMFYDTQMDLYNELTWAHCIYSYKAPGSSWWSYRDLPFIKK